MGLVNKVVPAADLDHEVAALAARIVDKPRDVISLGKRAFYDEDGMDLEGSYRHATRVIVQNAIGPDFGEGAAAFAEKRKPVWPGRG